MNIQNPAKYRYVNRRTVIDTRNSSPSVSVDDNDAVYGSTKDIRQGSSVNEWRYKVAKRLDASSTYLRTINSCRVPLITAHVKYENTYQGYTIDQYQSLRTLGNSILSLTTYDTALYDQVVARFKRKAASQSGRENFAPPLGELKDLHGTIGGINNMTIGLLQTLISAKRRKGRLLTKHAADAWLTYSFGVQPMLSDFRKLCRSLSDYYQRNDFVTRLSAYGKKQWTTSSINGGYSGIQANLTCYQNISHTLSYRVSGAFKFDLRSNVNYDLGTHLGLEITNLPSVAWELTPYSWVVDYLTTAGAVIDDFLDEEIGNQVYLICSRLYKADVQNSLVWTPSSNPAYKLKEYRNGTAHMSYTEFERTILPSIPHRVLRFKTFDEIGSHGLTKLTNLLGVLIQRKH